MIIESGPGNGTVLWMLGSVLLKGVREKEFPEFFEKSIDKQKIDAILNSAVRFWSDVMRRRDWGRASPAVRCFGGEAGDHPDTTTDEKSSGNVCALRRVRETATGHCSLVLGVFFEKC